MIKTVISVWKCHLALQRLAAAAGDPLPRNQTAHYPLAARDVYG